MAPHDFERSPGESLCRHCFRPFHCAHCDEGLLPWESHLYRNNATGRHEYSCVRKVPRPAPVPIVNDPVVHVVRPVRR